MPEDTPTGALLVCGAGSGAGKSTVVAGLCRSLARRGATVAPFKAQNMSNHSAVAADGGEVGRAQAMQAAAAGTDVTTAMNPILLKPAGDRTSHVVVRGRETGRAGALEWGPRAVALRPVVLDALAELRSGVDVVVGEGAGGAAEINLLDRDVVNVPLAAATGTPVLLVVDIERGGAFASAHGTVDLLADHLRATMGGIVFNRFRGDPRLLDPGIRELEARDGVPVLGVLPHLGDEPLFGVEDSLDVGADDHARRSQDPVRVAVVRFPRLANPSDLDPLAAEPDVEVRWATRPADLADADLVVLPGSRATVDDLAWLRRRGLDLALARTDADVIGICAGQQMLGTRIVDGVEAVQSGEPGESGRSGVVEVDGLGLVGAETVFAPDKVVRRRRGLAGTRPIAGYQIHLGRTTTGADPWLALDDDHGTESDGTAAGRVRTTSVHGVFDADGFRTELLADLADRRGRRYRAAPVSFAERLAGQHDRLADWIDEHLDLAAVDDLLGRASAPEQWPGWPA